MSDQGYFYISCLKHALTFGVEHYAEDTAKRTKFLEENGHLISGTMLVSVFAYLESTLGENWIERHGGRQTRELNCLKFIRDAFVHKNSHLRDLGSYTPAKEQDLRQFIQDMTDGKVTDDKGNVYPCYIEISSNGVVKFNEHAMQIIAALGKVISH